MLITIYLVVFHLKSVGETLRPFLMIVSLALIDHNTNLHSFAVPCLLYCLFDAVYKLLDKIRSRRFVAALSTSTIIPSDATIRMSAHFNPWYIMGCSAMITGMYITLVPVILLAISATNSTLIAIYTFFIIVTYIQLISEIVLSIIIYRDLEAELIVRILGVEPQVLADDRQNLL